MSEVHFATWDDQSTPANASGFNGFPAPFISGGGTWPAGAAFPLAKLSDWFWKSFTWSLSTDAAVTASGNTIAVPNGVMTGGPTTSTGGPAVDELDLVGQTVLGPAQQMSNSFSGDHGAAGVSIALFFDGSNKCPVIHFDGTDYFPALNINGGAQTAEGEPVVANLILSTDPTGSLGSITATLDGEPFTLYYAGIFDPGATFTLTFFDLTTNSTWPYT